MSVHAKLMQARLKLQNTPLKKSGHNKFAGYQYFELGDFLPVVQEIFTEVGLCGIVSYTADIAELCIYEVEGTGVIRITSPMGSAALKGCHEVQNVGAVETYQRRYLWVTALEIVEHDALDSAPPVDAPAAKPQKADKPPKLFSPPLATDTYMVDSARADIIFAAAKAAVGHHVAGDDDSAWEEVSGIDDNDEKQYLWSVIKEYSALRAAIKARAKPAKETV
jgi:hypothetical protein